MTTAAPTPGDSSPEEYDDDSNIAPQGQWLPHVQPDIEPASPSIGESAASFSQGPRVVPPLQKRRRVTRACDECRRKKINLQLWLVHESVSMHRLTVLAAMKLTMPTECTYDQPSNRRRNPAPQYIEAIENRLHRAEALLKTVLPDVDLDDPKLANAIPPNLHLAAGSRPRTQGGTSVRSAGTASTAVSANAEVEKDSLLESMVQRTGSLDLDDRGYWDFHGHSSGLIFLRRMREQFGDSMGEVEGYGSTFLQSRPEARVFDSPRSATDSPMSSNVPNTHDLPSKACGRGLCRNALDDACALMRFVHQPTFYAMFDRVYDMPPDQYGNEEHRYLPLVYSVMALGSLFAKSENSKLEVEGYESATDRGFKYFKASRQLMDICDCRDLPSLQAIIFMIIFLQSSAKLATCYSYIGVALHSAIRMGLHRSITRNFNPIELETRKRIFWQIRKMDFYVATMLGLPMMLSEDDIDQELPQEVDDEYITVEQILPMPSGRVPLIAATNAHTKMTRILQKVVRYIYPLKGFEQTPEKSGGSYSVSHTKIREIEQDLQAWMENLPTGLRPGGSATPELSRVQQLLRMAYAHVQMMLYRPFLHYVASSYHAGRFDKRSYACAAACVSVSRNIVHITAEMKRRDLLIGSYWFTMYTTFFAILALVFFVLENPNSSTSQDILKDAIEGREILASLAKRSMAADRCTVTLAALFDQLPKKLERGVGQSSTPRKRHAPSPTRSGPERTAYSNPNLSTPPKISTEHAGHFPRASTFPKNPSLMTWKRNSLPYNNSSPLAETQRRSSHDIYPSSSSGQAGVMTPDSPVSSGLSFSSAQTPFTMQQGFSIPSALPDLSAMMFPSTDPFAYPNQPMTTLENRQSTKQENYDPNGLYNSTLNNAQYENPEVQLFGPLPPYLMGGHHPGIMQGLGPQIDMSGAGVDWSAQQQPGRTHGMNMDEIFGEEWKGGWMDTGGFGGQ
ncbi:hypothetical protein MMC17_007932 [Xylographa soralifera]|nr:hypothetical protein [Xylographa soralifera]